LKLENSRRVRVLGVTFTDSPMYHFVVMRSKEVKLDGLQVSTHYHRSTSYEKPLCTKGCVLEARNTDGISIIASEHVSIRNSDIESGDDNLVIKGGSRDVLAESLQLYRGKGLAIGSLGERGLEETVTNVVLRNISVQQCHYGMRLKTWQGGRGFVRNVSVASFALHDVKVGISVDQTYCASTQLPGGCASLRSHDAVRIEDVRFRDVTGTYWKAARVEHCVDCSRISYEGVNLRRFSASIGAKQAEHRAGSRSE